MKIISREELMQISEEYKLVLETEKHHDHEIIEDVNGTYRWKENPDVRYFIDERINLNDLIGLLRSLGYDKNSEFYRKLYRDMGYSIFGYWEIFYWEMNNENADQYLPNTK